MPEDQDPQANTGPVAGFIKENKVGIIVVAVLVIGGLIWSGTGSDEGEPVAEPTVSSTAQIGPETPSASPTASPEPSDAVDPSSSPEPTETPSSGDAEPTLDPGIVTTPEKVKGGQPKTKDGTPVVGAHAQVPELEEWEPSAEAFAAAWADTSGGKQAWLKRLKPLITQRLYDNFSYTDIRSLYDDKFVEIRVDEEEAAYKIFTAHYEENGDLFQGLIKVQSDGSWLVDTIAPPEE